MFKVLLVDDEIEILRDNSRLIIDLGYECIIARDGEEAIKLLIQEHPDIVLTDQKMPKKGGMAVLEAAVSFDEHIPVIFFTGYGSIDNAVNAMKFGAFDYLQKPFSPEKMESLLKKALEFRKKNLTVTEPKQNAQTVLKGVVGESPEIVEIAKIVQRVASSNSNVFIYGESGTGKELVARNIHYYSQRKDAPFIPLDCSALPSNLLESEIFGYEKGAFTGADKSKPGVIELANTGTLFLDEITELDHKLQSKLLRFIQERQFRRLGGQKMIDVDIRIVSATNRDPEEAVKQKLLRNDLYYRLNVVPIFIPPLRERLGDIPLLVNHFIKVYNPSFKRNIKGVTCQAMECLKHYLWPGNVRELQNIIERSMSLSETDMVDVNDLPPFIKSLHLLQDDEIVNAANFKEAKDKLIKLFSKKFFEDMIIKYDGNITKCAKIAGISRSSIYRILDEFNIKYEDKSEG